MALALNNLQRVDMPLNKETQTWTLLKSNQHRSTDKKPRTHKECNHVKFSKKERHRKYINLIPPQKKRVGQKGNRNYPKMSYPKKKKKRKKKEVEK